MRSTFDKAIVTAIAVAVVAIATPEASNGQELPFDPPPPHPVIERLGALEGILQACSTQYGADGEVVRNQAFRVSIQRRVFNQALAIDLLHAEDEWQRNMQSTLLTYDRSRDRLSDVTASAIGSVELWDAVEPWDDEVRAFRLRDKARFVIGDDPDRLLDFRKAYRSIGDDGYELTYHISPDDGETWSKLFHEVAVPASGDVELDCNGAGSDR